MWKVLLVPLCILTTTVFLQLSIPIQYVPSFSCINVRMLDRYYNECLLEFNLECIYVEKKFPFVLAG